MHVFAQAKLASGCRIGNTDKTGQAVLHHAPSDGYLLGLYVSPSPRWGRTKLAIVSLSRTNHAGKVEINPFIDFGDAGLSMLQDNRSYFSNAICQLRAYALEEAKSSHHEEAIKVASFIARWSSVRDRRTAGIYYKPASPTPAIVDCYASWLVVYPQNIKVVNSELKRVNNLLTTALATMKSRRVIILARPGSRELAVSVARIADEQEANIDFELIDTNAEFHSVFLDTILRLPLRIYHLNKPRYFFECRNNEVYPVRRDSLEKQINEYATSSIIQGTAPLAMAERLALFTNEFYSVQAVDLKRLIIKLRPIATKHGDTVSNLLSANSRFREELTGTNVDKNGGYIHFTVRDDSFPVFLCARNLAEQLGFQTTWIQISTNRAMALYTEGDLPSQDRENDPIIADRFTAVVPEM